MRLPARTDLSLGYAAAGHADAVRDPRGPRRVSRLWFRACLVLGLLLRSTRYSQTAILVRNGEVRVRKWRLSRAPILIRMGTPLMRVLDTGVRILPQREWEERERLLYRTLHGMSIETQVDGTLVLPCLRGETLATLLEKPALDHRIRTRSIELAVVALGAMHRLGFTHGDAMAENVMVDLGAGIARWFDFETVHGATRPMEWRRADDVRALIATCLARTAPDRLAETLERMLNVYGDEAVTRLVATSFSPASSRSLAFHLGQAPLSFQRFTTIGAMLGDRLRRLPSP